tara:strand:- start:4383 stop:5639 length:1257 start_codon:yes stop_codon:yes gene_type:complete
MKIILNFFFIFLLACGGKKESLTDLKSFTNQGEKIILVQNKNLNFTDINLINSLKKNKYYFYKDWSQSHQNKNNLINPVKISINKKKKSVFENIETFIVYKNKIITINKKSKINILNTDLKSLRSKKIYKRKIYKNYNIDFKIIAYKNSLILADNLGNIHSFNIENLNLRWKKKFGVPFKSNLKIQGNKLFLINSNSKIYSINTDNGNLNWSFETASNELKDAKSYQIAIYNNNLVFTNDNGEIYCLDLIKNNIKWSLIFQTANFENTPLIFKSSPISIDNNGYIYVSTNRGYTYAIDIKTGLIEWSKPIYSTNRFIITKKYLINSWKDRIFMINKLNGKIVLNKNLKNLKKNVDTFYKDLIIGDDQIYIFDNKGFKISLDKKNFNRYSKSKIAKNYKNLIIFNNNVYINTKNSILKY